mmetsp:Transcript_20096/g.50712  ORF Transcript_20096/g.50712 Transcript_20096/m.50712 type:complete len:133 (+) Transcript_20096:2062-2460(+)
MGGGEDSQNVKKKVVVVQELLSSVDEGDCKRNAARPLPSLNPKINFANPRHQKTHRTGQRVLRTPASAVIIGTPWSPPVSRTKLYVFRLLSHLRSATAGVRRNSLAALRGFMNRGKTHADLEEEIMGRPGDG